MVASADPRVQTVNLPGVSMSVTEAGRGEPVLLLHGFPQSSRAYADVRNLLSGQARLIVPDLRGAGATEAPDSRYDLTTLRDDIRNLLDALGIDRVAVVAHDYSALVAFSLCFEHPERVTRLVACSVPAPFLRLDASMLGSVRYLWFQYVLALPGVGPRLLGHGGQRLPRWLMRAFSARPGGLPAADVDAYLAALRLRGRAVAGSRLYRQLIVPEFVRILLGRYRGRALEVPTLILVGSEDAVIPRAALERSTGGAPNVRIEFIPDAAHFVIDDQPEEVARRIAGFLRLPA